MAAEKTLAIVLRTVDFSETSVVATLFTEKLGKISALAKGARRRKSPFEAALDLLALCEAVFLHKASDALDLLTEAKLERRFRGGARDLSRLHAGYYVAELLNVLTDEADPHPALFRAADATLLALEHEDHVPWRLLRFELTALRLLGHMPSLDRCVETGGPVTTRGRIPFALSGGVLSPDARIGRRRVVSVSRQVIDVLKKLSADGPAANGIDLSDADRTCYGELRSVLNRYVEYLLGRQLKMHPYLLELR